MMYFDVAGSGAAELPLDPGGKAGAAASPQPGLRDLVDHCLGRHVVQHLGQRRVAAGGDVILDAGGVDQAVEVEQVTGLPGVEGNIVLVGDLLSGNGIGVEQAVDDLVAGRRPGDDFVHILRLDGLVEDALRLHHKQRPLLAEAVTAGHAHIGGGAVPAKLSPQSVEHPLTAVDATAGAPAERDTGAIGITTGDDGFSLRRQVGRGAQPLC